MKRKIKENLTASDFDKGRLAFLSFEKLLLGVYAHISPEE